MFTQRRVFSVCVMTFLTLMTFSVLSLCRANSSEITVELEISGHGEVFAHSQTVLVNKQSTFNGVIKGRKEQREIIFNGLVTYNQSKTKFILEYQVELQGKAGSRRPQLQAEGQIETLPGKKMTVLECGGWQVNIRILGGIPAKPSRSLSNFLLKADVICRNGKVSYKGMTTLDSQIKYAGMVDRNEFVFNALITRNDKNKTNLTFQYSVGFHDRNANTTMLQTQGEGSLLPGQRKTLVKNQSCQLQVQVDGAK